MARTNRDTMHLLSLRALYRSEGCFPSYSRIASHLGFKAKNAAFKLIGRLVSSGHLVKSPGGRVAPSERFFTLDLSDDEVRAAHGSSAFMAMVPAAGCIRLRRPVGLGFLRRIPDAPS